MSHFVSHSWIQGHRPLRAVYTVYSDVLEGRVLTVCLTPGPSEWYSAYLIIPKRDKQPTFIFCGTAGFSLKKHLECVKSKY